jgi:hypothetical protein
MTTKLPLLFIGNFGLTELIILLVFVFLVFMLPFRLYNRKRDKPIVKNIFAVLYLIIGLALIGFGVATINYFANQYNSFEGQISNELSNNYRSNSHNGGKMMGFTLVVIGLFFLISGIILIAAKSSSKQKIQISNTPPSINNSKSDVEDKLAQIEKLGVMKEKGLITEEEFQQQKKRILE